ncbi:hypothetical protein B2J93_2730 [Marssonina coronariae]|uniref:Uncharacterized protein n=1 Tax=Diplocarpon coronariae TaxID=2795749 RepID=A0A218Z431_9HELO|nr:hypothetical protein B2J93_2730 [Marssonina coronariae]
MDVTNEHDIEVRNANRAFPSQAFILALRPGVAIIRIIQRHLILPALKKRKKRKKINYPETLHSLCLLSRRRETERQTETKGFGAQDIVKTAALLHTLVGGRFNSLQATSLNMHCDHMFPVHRTGGNSRDSRGSPEGQGIQKQCLQLPTRSLRRSLIP